MQIFQIVLVLLLVILVGLILSIGLKHTMGKWANNVRLPENPAERRLYEAENNPLFVGSEGRGELGAGLGEEAKIGGKYSLEDEIYERMTPYIREAGDKNVIDYLLTYLNYSKARQSKLKRDKYPLKTVIEEIILDHDVKDLEDFLRKTRLNYGSFLDDERRAILTSALLDADVSDKDKKDVKHLYDDYLIAEEVTLTGSKLKEKVDELLLAYREFKLKKAMVKTPVARLKKLAKSSPNKVFEIDLLGMRAAMQREARRIANRNGDKDVMNKLKRDIIRLKLLREYPDIYIDDVYTVDELARRLAFAANKLYPTSSTRRYVSPILSDIAREKAEMDKYAAQREARQASDRASKAEREREEERKRALEERQKREAAEHREAERFRREEEERARELERDAQGPHSNDARETPPGVDNDVWREILEQGEAAGKTPEELRELITGQGEDPYELLNSLRDVESLDNIA